MRWTESNFHFVKRDGKSAVPFSAKPALRHRRVDYPGAPVSVPSPSRRPAMMDERGGIGIEDGPNLPPAEQPDFLRTPDMVHGLASCEDI
jgi:hypothetical protein